jgi:hypothetical protein
MKSGLISRKTGVDAGKQRLHELAVEKMVHATRSSNAEKDTLLQEAIELMDKATKSSVTAGECLQQFEVARTALSGYIKQLVATLAAVTSAVCHGTVETLCTSLCPSNCPTLIKIQILSTRPLYYRSPEEQCQAPYLTPLRRSQARTTQHLVAQESFEGVSHGQLVDRISCL